MKTKTIIFLIFLLANILSHAQNVKNGVYKNPYNPNHNYICINNDTIIICFYNYKSCYKGTYQLKDNHIILTENTLLGKNASIRKEDCSADSIELRLITKHKHYLIGMPSNDTNIYEYESNIYTMIINEIHLISRDTNGIYISKGQFTAEELSNGFYLDDSGSGFQDYFSFPLKYGTRYIVDQKYYEFKPSIINKKESQSLVYIYDNDKIIIKRSTKDKHSAVYEYVSPNYDSCLYDLKNRFPLLFE